MSEEYFWDYSKPTVRNKIREQVEEFWETSEEKDAFRHIENMTRARDPSIPPEAFAGNYEGPLYAPHPDLNNE